MNIFDVVVETDDLVVLGSPSVMDVTFDIGATGQRGTKTFIGAGDPAAYNFGSQVIYENDVYVDATPASPTYGWMYTYTSGPMGNEWTPALSLIQPAKYWSNVSATFTNGLATMSLSLMTMFGNETVTDVNKYFVHMTPLSTTPAAFTITSKTITGSAGSRVLNLSISMLSGTVVATPVWTRATGSQLFAVCVEVTP